MEVLLIGLAAWMVWEAVRAAWPFTIWPFFQLVIVAGAAYGLTYADDRIITALSAAAVVAAIRQVMLRVGIAEAQPVRLTRKPRPSGRGRIPDLPR